MYAQRPFWRYVPNRAIPSMDCRRGAASRYQINQDQRTSMSNHSMLGSLSRMPSWLFPDLLSTAVFDTGWSGIGFVFVRAAAAHAQPKCLICWQVVGANAASSLLIDRNCFQSRFHGVQCNSQQAIRCIDINSHTRSLLFLSSSVPHLLSCSHRLTW